MKTISITLLFLIIVIGSYAQNSNLILFTEGGEKFSLFLNGIQVNEAPLNNVKAEDINMEMAQIRVVFETPGAPVLSQGIMFEPGMEMTAIIMKNKKGKYIFRPVGSVPTAQAKPASQTVAVTQPVTQQSVAHNNYNDNEQVITTTSTTTTSNPNVGGNTNFGVNINEAETGFSMNVSVNLNDVNTHMAESSMTTTTVTTTSSDNEYQPSVSSKPVSQPVAVAREGCSTPMSASDYARAKQSIIGKSFSEEKMTIFNQVLRANCVSVSQVVDFMGLFTYEDDKITVAKNAYKKTVDKGNYYQINDAFTYSGSVDELNEYLESQ